MLRMNSQFKPIASMEAISHQSDLRFRNLANIFSKIQVELLSDENRKLNTRQQNELRVELLNEADIPKFLMESFGIRAKLEITNAGAPIAAVATSVNNRRAALLDSWRQEVLDNESMKRLYKKHHDDYRKMIALIDRKNVRLGGILSELEQRFIFDVSWLDPDNCTVEQAAAVFFHEIGHVFTFYELAISETHKNEIMTAVRQLEDPAQKEELAYLVVPEEYRTDEKMNKLLESDDALVAVMESGLDKTIRDEIGNRAYSERGWEQLADDFAIKLGAGEYLFSALDMLHEGSEAKRSSVAHLFNETLKVLTFGLMLAIPPYAPIAAILIAGRFLFAGDKRNNQTDYDPPDKRMVRMRQELIGRLRERSITREEKEAIVSQIKAMDEVIKQYSNRPTFFDIVASFGGLRGRKIRNSMKEQALLEKLANNELHLLTSKLDQYGEK